MLSDPIADMLTRIRNGYMTSKKEVGFPYSKFKHQLTSKLKAEGYIKDFKVDLVNNKSKLKYLTVLLKYLNTKPAITKIRRISKPSLRVYAGYNKIPKKTGSLGIVVISTSKGLMTDKEAKQKKLGGEIICQVW